MRKLIAEFIGTFMLALVVLLSLAINPPLATPVLAALTLGIFVYAIGHVSGTHINPAVTVGIFTLGKIKPLEAVGYVAAQFLGGAAAYMFVFSFLAMPPLMPGGSSTTIFLAETMGMLLFSFGIASAVYGKAPSDFSGVVVGGSLLLGIVLAVGMGSGGILNPAVAFALSSLNVAYLGGSVVGSILGFQLYRLVCVETAPAGNKKK